MKSLHDLGSNRSAHLLRRQVGDLLDQPAAENVPVAHLAEQVGIPLQLVVQLLSRCGVDDIGKDPQRAA